LGFKDAAGLSPRIVDVKAITPEGLQLFFGIL